jgi:hypothetical protein
MMVAIIADSGEVLEVITVEDYYDPATGTTAKTMGSRAALAEAVLDGVRLHGNPHATNSPPVPRSRQ